MPCIRHGAGLLFCPATIQPHTSVYSGFYHVHAVIQQTPQNSAQGFTGAFPAIYLVLPPLCGGCICLYCTGCDTLERITVPKRLQRIPDTTVTPGHCTGQHSRIPCKPGGVFSHCVRIAGKCCVLRPAHLLTGQRIHLHRLISAAVSILPTPSGWSPGTVSAVRAQWLAPSTRRGSPVAGTRRAARNH